MKDYVTIIIAHHEGSPPRAIRIRKSYLRLGVLLVLFLLLLSIISYLLNLKLAYERGKVLAEGERLRMERLKALEEKERLEREREQMRQRLKSIESKLLAIEDHLSKRGVLERQIAVGGASYKKSVEDVYYLNFLEQRSQYLLSTIRSVPMGYPVYGRITSHVGWRKSPFGRGYEFHSGIDIEAPYGSPVVATADGTVEYAGSLGEYGKTVIISHPSGYTTLYAHLSEISVKEGQRVKAGEVIGRVGSTGRSTGPHLHYEVLYQGRLKNPLDYISWK